MTTTLAPCGPTLDQHRLLVTEIPGPRSRALLERRQAVVARGVGTVLPVFVERAGGGVLVDVDGNSLIDLGSGIAVVGVGNAAPCHCRTAAGSSIPHARRMASSASGFGLCQPTNQLPSVLVTMPVAFCTWRTVRPACWRARVSSRANSPASAIHAGSGTSRSGASASSVISHSP